MRARLVKRNEALANLDICFVRRYIVDEGITDYTILVALHKARYEIVEMGARLRRESQKWLEDRGYSRLRKKKFPDGLTK